MAIGFKKIHVLPRSPADRVKESEETFESLSILAYLFGNWLLSG